METTCWFYIPIIKMDYATLQHQETNRVLGISIKATAVVACQIAQTASAHGWKSHYE